MEIKPDFQQLLGDYTKFDSRLKHLKYDTDVCGDRVEVRSSYISFRDDVPTFDEFVDAASNLLISFCLPRREIKTAHEIAKNGSAQDASIEFQRLSTKARELFMAAQKGSHRSGEGGEIVLYLLNEWILHAPQIVSKMYLKTNKNMPVYGSDGIHAAFDETKNRLLLFWGESKAHATLNGATTSALNSIKGFLKDAQEKREVDIIKDHYDLDGLSEKAIKAIMDYLNPYSEKSNERVTIFSCLLMYSSSVEDGVMSETDQIELFRSTTEQFIKGISDNISGKGLSATRFEFFLLPIPDVQDFRDKFQSKIGWPK